MSGEQGRRRGLRAERRFIKAFRGHPKGMPPWFKGVRHATKEEDAQGIDAWAELDIGDIPIQIKSTERSLRNNYEKYKAASIVVLIIFRNFSNAQIVNKTANFMERERSKRLRDSLSERPVSS